MSVRNNFFTELAGASMWDVAVAINRGNALPLDRYSVFQSLEEVNTYINNPKGSIAYPGQVLAVVGENATTVYYLDQNLAVKPVGVIPSGDNRSIEVTAEGAISLLGAATAENGTLPMLENGALVWKTLEDIGAGDGNDDTTYEITGLSKGEGEAAEVYGIQIQAKFNGQNSGEPILIPFDVYTKSAIDEVVGGLNDRISTLEQAEDKDTTYSVKEGEKILKLEGTEFSTVAALKYLEAAGEEPAKIQLLGIDNAVVSEIDATPFIRDGMLKDVEYDAETNTLSFTWNTEAGDKTDTVVLSDIIDPYTAGNGLDLSGNEFAIKVAEGSEAFLFVDENGLKVSGIQDAIDTAKGEAAQDATDKADQALADAKEDAAKLYATKEYVGTIPSNYTENNVIAFINKKAEEVLSAAQGGSSETAASVKQQLDNYKSTNDTRVEGIEKDIEAIEDKLGTVEENAQANIIETVKVNGTALVVSEKAVDITVPTKVEQLSDYTTISERITAAKNQADKGVDEAGKANAAAATNADAILALQNRVTPLENAKSDHETRIIALENADSQHTSEYNALKEIVDGHTTAIAAKAEQTLVNSISAKASANETAIKTLNETTIPGLNTEIGKKANATDVYTKTEIGAIEEGKTVVKMIEEAQAAASYDDAEVRGLIGDNAAAIAAIYTAPEGENAATGILATEIARVEGLVSTEQQRAEGIEANHEGRIATMENFWKAADDPEGTIDKLAEIVKYIEDDKSGALDMAADIQANTDAIAAIYVPAKDDTPASGALSVEIERAKAAEKANADAIAAINNEDTGILAKAKKYTDDSIAALPFATAEKGGLVKSSSDLNKIAVAEDGTMEVNQISTSKLYNDTDDELILNGGGAAGY